MFCVGSGSAPPAPNPQPGSHEPPSGIPGYGPVLVEAVLLRGGAILNAFKMCYFQY